MVVLETFNAVPVVDVIEFPVPVTLMVPPPVALKPVPEVTSISRPPLLKFAVVPALPVNDTAVFAPVFKVFVVPAKLILTPEFEFTNMPVLVPVEDNVLLKVIVPPELLVISINLPALFLLIDPLQLILEGVLLFTLKPIPLGLVIFVVVNANEPDDPDVYKRQGYNISQFLFKVTSIFKKLFILNKKLI